MVCGELCAYRGFGACLSGNHPLGAEWRRALQTSSSRGYPLGGPLFPAPLRRTAYDTAKPETSRVSFFHLGARRVSRFSCFIMGRGITAKFGGLVRPVRALCRLLVWNGPSWLGTAPRIASVVIVENLGACLLSRSIRFTALYPIVFVAGITM